MTTIEAGHERRMQLTGCEEGRIGLTTAKPSKDTFRSHLRAALEHIDSPEWLDDNSPFAAPYFLGADDSGHNMSGGALLQGTLLRCARSLWGDTGPITQAMALQQARLGHRRHAGNRYDYLVLDARYFRQHFQPDQLSHIWQEVLHVSKPSFYRYLDAAEKALAEVFLRDVNPSVWLEQPPRVQDLVGRSTIVADVVSQLGTESLVALTGATGSGKTSVAAEVCRQSRSGGVFWYTFRPGFNDRPVSLVFALAHFLRRQGAAALWRQLVADGGRVVDLGLALGMAKHGLEQLNADPPLFCFDDIQVVGGPDGQRELLRNIVRDLRGHASLLLVGIECPFEATSRFVVEPLDESHVAEIVQSVGIAPSKTLARDLHEYTAGNAGLLRLALSSYGDSAAELVAF